MLPEASGPPWRSATIILLLRAFEFHERLPNQTSQLKRTEKYELEGHRTHTNAFLRRPRVWTRGEASTSAFTSAEANGCSWQKPAPWLSSFRPGPQESLQESLVYPLACLTLPHEYAK